MNSQPRRAYHPIWSRPEPEPRLRVTRGAIVAAAIRLADTEGLDAVSIRRVAGLLGVRPMTLYGHIGGKEDLLDLMFDELPGQVLEGPPLPAGWREALVEIATRKRRVCLTHPWAVTLYGQRPLVGPHTLAQLQQAIGALHPVTTDLASAVRIANAVDDFTMGHVTRELTFGAGTPVDWRESMRPYLLQVAASGRYPLLAPLLTGSPLEVDNDDTFVAGLAWLLDGIEGQFGAG